MAIMYLGINNQPKKVLDFYVGVNNVPKQVVKGYVGVNGVPKLFYELISLNEDFPTLKEGYPSGSYYQGLDFWFNSNNTYNSSFRYDTRESLNRIYYQNIVSGGVNTYRYHISSLKCYLNKNSSNFFKFPYSEIGTFTDIGNQSGSVIIPDWNLEHFLLFNKVENLCNFFTTAEAQNFYFCNPANLNFINVINMYRAFYNGIKLIGSPQSGPNVINMGYAYYNCQNLTGSPVCGPNVINMSESYDSCKKLTGNPISGPNVTNMCRTYFACYNLTGSPVCGPNVIDMSDAYYLCRNLTGSPVCGPNVIKMYMTYGSCVNLTGSPVCGSKVINMGDAYFNCKNLTGSPICGPNVIDMSFAYYLCQNLTGSPVCGPNVVNMMSTYSSCYNLTGSPVCGSKVINMSYAYWRCENLSKTNLHFYGNNIIECFQYANIYGNIYLHNTSVNFNNISYEKQGSAQLNIYIRSSLPLSTYYKQVSSQITSYTQISSTNWQLIGETNGNIYLSNNLTS